MNQDIKEKLKILDINSLSQFQKGDIDYWWAIKYKEIQSKNFNTSKKQTLLIELNQIRDELSVFDLEVFKNIFLDHSEKKEKFKKVSSRKSVKSFLGENWYFPLIYIPIRLLIKYFQDN